MAAMGRVVCDTASAGARWMHRLGVVCVSLLVAGTMTLCLVTPASQAGAMSSAVRSIPRNAIVFYGKVDNSQGSPVAGVRVKVSSRGGEVTHTGVHGTYRIQLAQPSPSGTYTLSFARRIGRRWVYRVSIGVIARDGRAYDVSVQLQLNGSAYISSGNGSVYISPITSY